MLIFSQFASSELILNPNQLSGIKEHFLPAYAERFQKAGYAVVLYDHRNWGESDGLPRHHSSHYEQTQDTHDVIYYTSTQLNVDPARIALWGSSFSGGIALIAGAIDPRVKVVVSQVPFISGRTTRSRLPAVALAKIFADRGQTTSSDPTYIPIYPETLEEARNPANGAMMGTEECFRHYEDVRNLEPRRETKSRSKRYSMLCDRSQIIISPKSRQSRFSWSSVSRTP